MIKYIKGDIFTAPAQVITNTVNLEGVMGKGIALEFKKRYPDMFKAYKKRCDSGEFKIGNLMLYRDSDKWILLFPTKDSWRRKSKLEYIEKGLQKFADNWDKLGVDSIAFPPLGCGNGGLLWSDVRPLMEKYLKKLPIDIYIYTDIFCDANNESGELSDFERMLNGENGLDGYRLFKHKCITYLAKNGEVTVDDNKVWAITDENELILDLRPVDESNLIGAWNYIRNVKVISKDEAEQRYDGLLYPLMGLMRKIDYTCRIYVSKDGVSYTNEPNAYSYSVA
ncbi:macro domain-containing protein [Butyrivibrio sp. AC2005]|uniref:macro domain-containing protein n=1 Tax=Butyrivibrio sp. AC2005 TaxID=1280672 RepID=UPI000410BF90|nr:macro domain-containing protein [Butyrivibrio sp. AC2005]